MRRTATSFAALLLAAPVAAQEPATEREVVADALADITTRLSSGDLATVAWAAHDAAQQQLAEAVPALRRRLAELAWVPARRGHFAQLAVLDALVQNDASMTARELEPFRWGLCEVPALALTCRNATANREWLLERYRWLDDEDFGYQWLAIGNVLAEQRDPMFATGLLQRSTATVSITVCDPDAAESWWDSDTWTSVIGCGGCGQYQYVVPPGHPPTVVYELGPRQDHPVLARGSKTVFLHRRMLTDRSIAPPAPDHEFDGAQDELRHAWIAQMLGMRREAIPFATRTSLCYPWQGPAALLDQVTRQRISLVHRFVDLVSACVEAKLTTRAAMRFVQPVVHVRLLDTRQDPSEPLPEIAGSR